MSTIQIILDVSMCMLWITTYTLVLFGTIRYRYPLISPITQAIIAPFEFSVLFLFIKLNAFQLNYASVAYLCWSVIEIVTIIVIVRAGYIRKKYILPYVGAVLLITGIMVWLVAVKQYMLAFSYINTFVGMSCWLAYVIRRKDYPMNGITLTIFLMKLTADILGCLVYFGQGSLAVNALSVMLPVVDFCFIPTYFMRKKKYTIDGDS